MLHLSMPIPQSEGVSAHGFRFRTIIFTTLLCGLCLPVRSYSFRANLPSDTYEATRSVGALDDPTDVSLDAGVGIPTITDEEYRTKLNRLQMIIGNTGSLVQERERLKSANFAGESDSSWRQKVKTKIFFLEVERDKLIVLAVTVLIELVCIACILMMRHEDALYLAEEAKAHQLPFHLPGHRPRFVCGGLLTSDLAAGLLWVLGVAAAGFCFLWWVEFIQPFLKDLVVYIYLGVLILMLIYVFGSVVVREMGLMKFVLSTLMDGITEMQAMADYVEKQTTGGCGGGRRSAKTGTGLVAALGLNSEPSTSNAALPASPATRSRGSACC